MSNGRSSPSNTARKRPVAANRAPPDRAGVKNPLIVVGIGASAGGLDACRKLLDALPHDTGLAFILVQHLAPNHDSLLVNLLATHTRMPILQASDGLLVERDHLYVIPPGAYLAIANGALRLSQPRVRQGARLPFDFLLHSIAAECGNRGIAVVLSGTGGDGSAGLASIREKHGLVIAQEPAEADYDGMPRSAIHTAMVDQVLPVADIPGALIGYARSFQSSDGHLSHPDPAVQKDRLTDIIDLLRTRTPHDFTHYRQGTLRRRIARRMGLARIEAAEMGQYLELLQSDAVEMDQLAAELLINVTKFFRDPKVFEHLAKKVVPALARNQAADQPIRIWVAGCSTGEEAYSLAIIFREKLAEIGRDLKLQVFASDVDPDAIATAREAVYPKSIEADVSPERLAKYFVKAGRGYRVSAKLRTAVVFTVHDLLSDAPFSRLDLISCRNVMIYLDPGAQEKILSIFHFALREGGVLLLGGSEIIPHGDSRYQTLSKPDRTYQHVGHGRPDGLRLGMRDLDGDRVPTRIWQDRALSRQTGLAELCGRLVLENFAPAAVLIDRQNQCLYSLGPVDRYLSVATGLPSTDLLVIARENVRAKLRSAIQRAGKQNERVLVPSSRLDRSADARTYHIAVQPAVSDGENMFLVCFIDDPKTDWKSADTVDPKDGTRVSQLETELRDTRQELLDSERDLNTAHEEQRAIDAEASSVNEEYQSANEELLTSKEELQSLNEELVTLNHQLQETLGRERVVFDDLQNVMHSTDVATLFLDTDLNIRLFTPATKALFGILPLDVGRPLVDFKSYADDTTLVEEANAVLRTAVLLERDVEAGNGIWFRRRILPYRSQEGAVEGVVITFSNITDQRRVSDALEAAKRQADQANMVKSRFLAVASHDLRQPLQTLTLLQGLLARQVTGKTARKLVERFEDALDAMSGILNTLLDINRIEAGTVRAEMEEFPVNDILQRLTNEFAYHAQAKGLSMRHIPCSLTVHSDPRLLEQILRNFISNALKYTNSGKILIGCRRHKDDLRVEVWDTGIGIPEPEQQAVFDEYHQLDNPAHERSRGLGLGLSIVRQLGSLLGHRISVRSQLGKGSVFAIEVSRASHPDATSVPTHGQKGDVAASTDATHVKNFLVVEDDPGVRELLVLLLEEEGHAVVVAPDGPTALRLIGSGMARPDLVLADFNLPNGLNGLQVVLRFRDAFHYQIPSIILTGDISTGLLRDIGQHDCVHLSKPVKLANLMEAIGRFLPETRSPPSLATPGLAIAAQGIDAQGIDAGTIARPMAAERDGRQPIIYVIDDDALVSDSLRQVLEADGQLVQTYPSSEAFLEVYAPGRDGCLLVDAQLPGMDGLDLLRRLQDTGDRLPSIMITGFGDVPMAVNAMQAGAIDFIEKPVGRTELLASVHRALALSADAGKQSAWQDAAAAHIASLTPRQRDIMQRVLAGHPSKNIAADLGISQRTVENHRAEIMKRTSTKSLPALARLALAATGFTGNPNPEPPPD